MNTKRIIFKNMPTKPAPVITFKTTHLQSDEDISLWDLSINCHTYEVNPRRHLFEHLHDGIREACNLLGEIGHTGQALIMADGTLLEAVNV